MEIYLYFQDQSNRIRELRFEGKTGTWDELCPTGAARLKGLAGTSIACGADSGYASARWMYTQSAGGDAREYEYQGDKNKWTLSKSLELRLTKSLQQIIDLRANIRQ